MSNNNYLSKHKTLFIGSLYQSGGDSLQKLVAQHPDIAVHQSDSDPTFFVQGQHIQTVFPPDEIYGGKGYWGFDEIAHFTESNSAFSDNPQDDLQKEWFPFWEINKEVFVEFSTTNLLKSRFLQSHFSNALPIFVLRHPIDYAYSLDNQFPNAGFSIEDLVRHWIFTHQKWMQDCPYLDDFILVFYEDLLENPQEVCKRIFKKAGLSEFEIEPKIEIPKYAAKAQESWELEFEVTKKQIKKWENYLVNLPYSLEKEYDLAQLKNWSISSTTQNALKLENLIPSYISQEKFTPAPSKNPPQKLLLITFGTRGDIQPYIALALGFIEKGYKIWICSTDEHGELIRSYGVPFASAGVNHAALNREVSQSKGSRISGPHVTEFFDDIEIITKNIREFCLSKEIEGVFSKLGIIDNSFYQDYLNVSLTQFDFIPLAIDSDFETPVISSLNGYFGYYLDMQAAITQYGCNEKMQNAYDNLNIPISVSTAKENAFIRLKSNLMLWGITQEFPSHPIPGIAEYQVGPTSLPSQREEALSEVILNYLAAGEKPICLNFGSMDPYAEPWMDTLLLAIKQSGKRCISIGKFVPKKVREWTFWIDYVSHRLLFEQVEFVIHHGGAGTTAQCLFSGVPALIIPVILWIDQTKWGTFVQGKGAGIYINAKEFKGTKLQLSSLFSDALRDLSEEKFRLKAQEFGQQISKEGGIENAIRIFEDFHRTPSLPRQISVRALENIAQLPLSKLEKLNRLLFAFFYDRKQNPLQIFENQEYTHNLIKEGVKHFIPYEKDWPTVNKTLQVEKHDLPHDSSGMEQWSFYGNIKSLESEGTFRISSNFFKNILQGKAIWHEQHTIYNDASNTFQFLSQGDEQGPKQYAKLIKPRYKSDYLQRTFVKSLNQGTYLLPDRKGKISQGISFKKGSIYHITAKHHDGISYDLELSPSTRPKRNTPNGAIGHLHLISYSIPQMSIKGQVNIDGKSFPVEGEAWYERRFGDLSDHKRMDKKQDISWNWFFIQLEDGSSLCINPELKKMEEEACSILFFSPKAEEQRVLGQLTAQKTWTSLTTYITYDVAWKLNIPELDLELSLVAEIENQEIISLLAQPAWWKGSFKAIGKKGSKSVAGYGFAEQIGKGNDIYNYNKLLKAVSKQVLETIENCYPMNPSQADWQRLITGKSFKDLPKSPQESLKEELIYPVRDLTDRGGKGWRSMIIMVCIAALGKDPNRFKDFLSFPELIHSGSLIIDDIQDDSEVRRGKKTIHQIYGQATAINAGTAAYFVPETILQNYDLPATDMLEIYQLYFLTLRGGHAGQALDIKGLQHLVPACLERNDFTELWETMLVTHQLKSGLPASISAKLGAILAQSTEEKKTALGEYLLAIGVAFQIMDDVINLTGFQKKLKTKGEDLIAGKITAPVIKGFDFLKGKERQLLWQELENGANPSIVDQLIELLEDCGAIDFCVEYASKMVEDAWCAVDELLPDSYAKVQLRMFGQFVIEIRDY